MADKKLLILDIDETLIHATEKQLELEHDFETQWYFVYKRPLVHAKLMQYLLELKDVENIRQVEKRGWQKRY